MPFLTDIATGGVGPATYSAALSETSHSMIIANYGASQGFDNDDGSSWYDTHDNFFYDADGFKMVRRAAHLRSAACRDATKRESTRREPPHADSPAPRARARTRALAHLQDYGGHDSKFHHNVVIAVHGQNCVGTASFIAGHATSLYENDCVVYGTERVDDLFENCDKDLAPQVPMNGYNNRFYTALGNASATCDCCGLRPLAGQAWAVGIETNASAFTLPSGDTIIAWGRNKLFGE